MNERTFLQEFEQSVDRERLVEVVFDEMREYVALLFARENTEIRATDDRKWNV